MPLPSDSPPSQEFLRAQQLLSRARSQLANQRTKFDLKAILFEKQLAFARDTSRQQTAVCTRKAGKTFGCAAKLLACAMSRPNCDALYITLSRINAKRILWPTLCWLNRELNLGGQVRDGDLSISFPGRGTVYLSGANDSTEIEKFRGLSLGVAIIDEAQSFPAYLSKLVDEVLAPNLMVFAGSLVLIGTPGPVPIGYFYDCAHNPEWSHHDWSVFDNPHVERTSGKTAAALLEDELRRRGVGREDPVIQREWFARWILDTNSLVFRYDEALNDYDELPVNVGAWSHVIGVDLGFDDADAITVLSWPEHAKTLYLTQESVLAKQTITQLGERLKALEQQLSPLAIVIDTGGLGRKIEEELIQRWQIGVEAAEKTRKLEHIELLNDALRSGTFKAKRASRFAQDSKLVEWDKSNPEKWAISERYHSDACDAALYAHRKALHWLSEAPPEEKPMGTREWAEALAKEQEERHLDGLMRRIAEEKREAEEALSW